MNSTDSSSTVVRSGTSPGTTEGAPGSGHVRATFALGVLLTALAGYVDAIGYLALGGLFASFMSGASVALGVAVHEGHWAFAADAMLLIATFVGGAVGATVLAGVAGIWTLSLLLTLEGLLLGLGTLLAAADWHASQAIFAVVAAMGVQNTVLRPRDGVRLGATFMTGTLVSFSQGIGNALLGRGRPAQILPHAALWGAFTLGAGVGGFGYIKFGFVAVAGPAGLTGILAMIAFGYAVTR